MPAKNSKQQIGENVSRAVAILETAYIEGSNVRIEDAFKGTSVIIHTSAIPDFRMMLSNKIRENVLKEVNDAMLSSQEIRGDCMRDAIRVLNSLRSEPPQETKK